MTSTARESRTASLYRMVMPDHLCPFGLKSKAILEWKGFEVKDHPLRSHDEVKAFQRKHDVETTPQTFVDGKRVGGYEDVRDFVGLPMKDPDETTYQPVIAIFAVAFLMALAVGWATMGTLAVVPVLEWFIAISMCLLGLQKLRDVEGFSTMFMNYDLLARRWVPYAYIYPFAETLAGVLMIAGTAMWLAAPMALFIGTIGAVSVFKAVYVDRRDLKCACVGGGSNVPLGFVSLTENAMMMAMGLWMMLT